MSPSWNPLSGGSRSASVLERSLDAQFKFSSVAVGFPLCGRLTGITPCCCSKRRHRFPARPGNVSIRFDVASYLQGRAWISALRGLERDHQESVLHGPLAGAQKEGGAMPKLVESSAQRRKLLSAIERLAGVAIFETLSETYRTCGSDGSACSWSVGESSFCC